MQKEPMTEYGYSKLTNELKNLKEFERPAVTKEIEIAREYGDLKENAEYHAAKERQVFIESRINELSDVLARAQVINPSSIAHERVSFGSTIKLIDMDSEEEFEYSIVGASESNPDIGLISYNSPLAKALIGKEEGDEIIAKLPAGDKSYEIIKIYYKEIKFL